MTGSGGSKDVSALYASALALPAAERAQFLARECRGDEELRRKLESLLAGDPDTEPTLTSPAFDAPRGTRGAEHALVGGSLGPYRIDAPLGAGGMGEVYRATDTRLHRVVAIKILPARLRENADLRARFEREAQAVAALRHPHVCVLYDIGRADGIDFLVMELLEGETLAVRLARGPLPVDEALRYGRQIGEALVATHRQGMVHQDLKPANVMLTEAGAKLLDFGLAKPHAPSSADARSMMGSPAETPTAVGTTAVGTPAYMAPEGLDGSAADPRRDIFAFGAMLYEMVTGRRAFEGSDRAALMAAIRESEPMPLPESIVVTAPRLEAFIRKCIRKNPEERWRDAGEMTVALQTLVAAGPEFRAAKPRIVVSYARSDGTEFSHALSERLAREHGLTVWRDPSPLEGGTNRWRQSAEAIGSVEYLVLAMTPAALRSDVVQDEWRYARTNGVCVIPVIESRHLEFSTLPGWMRRTHFVDASQPEQWNRLIRTLEGPCRRLRVPMMAERLPEDYVARSSEFEALRAFLIGDERGKSGALTAALKGAGGYGKTTLARALCYDDHILETYYDGVLWVTLGESPGDAAAQLEDLIVTLSGEPSLLTSGEARKGRLDDLLQDRHLLIVIDDVWNRAHLQPFLIGGPHCARLVTTRDRQALPVGTYEISVDAMRSDEASALLGSGLPAAHRASLVDLAARLGDWPLLLRLANGMLRDRTVRSGDTMPRAFEFVNRLLTKRGLKAFDARDPVQRRDAVSATIDASVARLDDTERTRLKEIAVFAEDADIPLDAVALLWRRTGNLDEVDVEELLGTLFDLSLILDFNISRRRVRIHDVIRAYWIREWNDSEFKTLHSGLVEAYRTQCPQGWSSGPADGYFHRFLPQHLAAGGHTSELRQMLLDPDWIEVKLRYTDIAALLGDYRTWASDGVVHLVEATLTLAADVLTRAADQVLAQLLGRIEPSADPEVARLVATWRSRSRSGSWLCPATASLVKPGSGLIQALKLDEFVGLEMPSLSISDDARYLAVTHRRRVRIFDLTLSRPILELDAEVKGGARITPDGRTIVTGAGAYVALHDVTARRQIVAIQCSTPIVDIAVTPDGSRVAALAGEKSELGWPAVRVWSTVTSDELFVLENSGNQRLAISPDGRCLVLGRPAGVLELWSVNDHECLARWECAEYPVRALTMPSADTVVAASRGGTVQIWRLGDTVGKTTVWGRDTEASSVAVVPDGRLVVLGFRDGTLECWKLDGRDEQRLTALKSGWSSNARFTDGEVCAVTVTPDGKWVAAAVRNGGIRLWRLSESPGSGVVAESHNRILAVSPDGRRLMRLGDTGAIEVFDASTDEQLCSFDPGPSVSTVDAIERNGRWAASMGVDGHTHVWSLTTGERLLTFDGNVRSCTFLDDPPRILYVDRESVCFMKSLEEDAPSGILNPVGLRLSKDTRLIAAPGPNQVLAVSGTAVHAWDLTKREPVRPVMQATLQASHATMTDGRVIVLVSWDATEVWNLVTGAMHLRIESADSDGFVSGALTPSGRGLALANGRIVRFFGIDRRAEGGRFYCDEQVAALACPNEHLIIAGTVDGRVHRLRIVEHGLASSSPA